MDPLVVWGLLAALSFLPALGFMAWVRSHERHAREPITPVLGIFAYGGTLGVVLAILIGVLFDSAVARGSVFIAAVAVAPVVEELSKGLGFGLVRRHVDELEDGLVYGAAVGLGFAATETLLYAAQELTTTSLTAAVGVVAARNVSSLLLHAASSALLGYGYAVHRLRGGHLLALAGYYTVAVVLHAAYNALVITDTWIGFLVAIVVVITLMGLLMRRVRQLDAVRPAV